MPLGERIRRARERLRLSQQELADRLHVDRKSVSNWELGHTHPSRALLHVLEQVLGPLTGASEDLFTLAEAVRHSSEFTAGQRQALLEALGERPQGRHALTPQPTGW